MKKRIAIIVTIALLIATIIFVIISHQRRNGDPFLEFTITYVHTLGQPEFTFIIERDRTFTSLSYVGLRLAEEDEVTLSRQEFQRISELLNAVVDDYYYAIDNWLPRVHGSELYVLKHNGYTYAYDSAVHESLLRLYNELRRLSSLRFPRWL